MVYPQNYKTVFVFDHGPKMLSPSDEEYEYDVANKNRPNIIPLAALSKSHWTCSIEAGLEFCRIIYDIFGRKKLISFLASDTIAQQLTGWADDHQDLEYIQRVFGSLGLPRKAGRFDDVSILHGLYAATAQLLTPSQCQVNARLTLLDNADSFQNNGRIICVTVARSENQVSDIIDKFVNDFEMKNREALCSDECIPITNCELVLVLIHPVGSTPKVLPKDSWMATSNLTVTVIVTESGRNLANRMVALAVDYFNLVITSVTGIPMKEEQNANSSASYDVELLHSDEAHSEMSVELADGCRAPSQEISGVESVTLKWCTPKSSSNTDIQLCVGAYPISPVDANSRPSLCLTNFLLSGRSVMLEQPRRSGVKVLSHMLTSHGGQIYIHQLSTSRSILDDPPSISEGVGGRVTDYRIQNFGELIKKHALKPSTQTSADRAPIEGAESSLERHTRHWPLTISDTMIYNLQSHIDPLPELLLKDNLTAEDVEHCRSAIFRLITLESQNLLGAYSAHKGKKKEEHSRMMWSELELLVRAHSSTSPHHALILEILLNCRPAGLEDSAANMKKRRGTSDSRTDHSQPSTPSSELLSETGRAKSLPRSDSPLPKKSKYAGITLDFKGNKSVLSLWTERMNQVNNNRHAEFSGRAHSTSNKVKLYQKLEEGIHYMDDVDETTPGVKNCPDH